MAVYERTMVTNMEYLVYFDQVNQTRYDVEAETKEEAIKKATRYWKQDYGKPSGVYVEEVTK